MNYSFAGLRFLGDCAVSSERACSFAQHRVIPQETERIRVCTKSIHFIISILLDQLKRIIKEYFDRVYLCEGQKWDLEHEVRKRDWEVWR
jgi:hypothetical protein